MTNRARHAFLSILLALGIAMAGSASAEISDSERAEIRAIIESQITAFQRDDGPAAYSHASPTIQGLFPSADIFMTMVRSGYPQVYRPRSVEFGQIVERAEGPVQQVFITGPDGRNWVAVYELERQPDGTWKINGVRLVQDKGGMA